MDESFIFLDNGDNSFKVYNANKSINLLYSKDKEDYVRIKSKDIQPDKDLKKSSIEQKIKILDYNGLDSDSTLKFCSQYFNLNYSEERHEINVSHVIFQSIIVGVLYYFCWTSINFINVFTIDSVFSAIIFILKYHSKEDNYMFESMIYQTSYFIRLIYYLLLLGCYYLINFVTWNYFSIVLQFILPIFTLPIIIENIVYTYKFKKLTQAIRSDCQEFSYFIISKQMAKVVSIISRSCLNYVPEFKEDEFKPFVRNISVGIFVNFICSFIFASILHYLEQDGTTVFTAIFRQFYFRQYYFKKEKIDSDHKNYLINIMETRNWIKLLDPYTLNRIMKMYLKMNEDQEDSIVVQIKNIIDQISMSFSKMMTCWTISSLIKIRCIGILTYFLFVKSKHKINTYLKFCVVTFFTIISFFSYEQLLQIILCEICARIMVNKVTRDIIYDIYKHVKHILLQNTSFYVQNNTIILSCYLALSIISFNSFNVMSILLVMTITIRFVKMFCPSEKTDRIFIGMSGTLIFGYFSGYNMYHCLLLPYIFQLISSKENLMLLIKKKNII